MDEALYRELVKKRTKHVFDAFEHPPSTWEDFNQRLGFYRALTEQIDDMEAAKKAAEQREED